MRQPALAHRNRRRARLLLAAVVTVTGSLVVLVALVIASRFTSHPPAANHPPPATSGQPASRQASPSPPSASASPDLPRNLDQSLSRFLTAYYTRAANGDTTRIHAIQMLVPASMWKNLDTLVPGIPLSAAMRPTIVISKLQVQTVPRSTQLYLTVPVEVQSPGLARQTFLTGSVWQRGPTGAWTLLQFAG